MCTVTEIQKDFSGGKFDKAHNWAFQKYGKDGIVTLALEGELPWIKLWIDVRNAIEHPEKNRFVEMLNFSLEANRGIRLPTWRFIHPDYDMARPQNLLEAFENCINNILLFFEDLQIALIDGHLPSRMKVFIEYIPLENRDVSLPLRYKFHSRFESI